MRCVLWARGLGLTGWTVALGKLVVAYVHTLFNCLFVFVWNLLRRKIRCDSFEPSNALPTRNGSPVQALFLDLKHAGGNGWHRQLASYLCSTETGISWNLKFCSLIDNLLSHWRIVQLTLRPIGFSLITVAMPSPFSQQNHRQIDPLSANHKFLWGCYKIDCNYLSALYSHLAKQRKVDFKSWATDCQRGAC